MRATQKNRASSKAGAGTKKILRLDPDVYDRLVAVAGSRDLSKFVDSLIPRAVSPKELATGYRAMAADKAGEAEALEWAEALLGDVDDEAR